MSVTEGSYSLRWFIGKEVNSDYTIPEASKRLLSDKQTRKQARAFWKNHAHPLIEQHTLRWQNRFSGMPACIALEKTLTVEDVDVLTPSLVDIAEQTRVVRLYMQKPLKWAAAIGRTMGVWETYSQSDCDRWSAAKQPLPPRTVVDVGQDSLVRMVAFALVNQCDRCTAIVDGAQITDAKQWLRDLQEALEELPRKHVRYTSGGAQVLLEVLLRWLDTRVHLHSVQLVSPVEIQYGSLLSSSGTESFQSRISSTSSSQSNVTLTADEAASDIHRLLYRRQSQQLLNTERGRVAEYLQRALTSIEDYTAAELLIVNNLGDCVFELAAAYNTTKAFGMPVEIRSMTETEDGVSRVDSSSVPLNKLIDVTESLESTSVLRDHVRLSNAVWVAPDAGLLNFMESPTLSADHLWSSEGYEISSSSDSSSSSSAGLHHSHRHETHAPEPAIHWYAQMSAEHFFTANRARIVENPAKWVVLLHAPSPRVPCLVTKDVANVGQPLLDSRLLTSKGEQAFLRLQLMLKNDDAFAWRMELRAPIPLITHPRTPPPASQHFQLSQWVYRRVTTELNDRMKIKVGEGDAQSSTDWIVRTLVKDDSKSTEAWIIRPPYTWREFMAFHQTDISRVLGLMPPSDTVQQAPDLKAVLTPRQWDAFCKYLQHAYVVQLDKTNKKSQKIASVADTVDAGVLRGDRYQSGLLGNTSNIQVVWLTSHARRNNASLSVAAFASRTIITSNVSDVGHVPQHIMMVPSRYDQWILCTGAQYMFSDQYWAMSVGGGARAMLESQCGSKTKSPAFGNILPVGAVRVEASVWLHRAIQLHEQANLSGNEHDYDLHGSKTATKMHKEKMLNYLRRHVRESFSVQHRVSEPTDKGRYSVNTINAQRVRLIMVDLTAIVKPLNFWKSLKQALTSEFGALLMRDGVKHNSIGNVIHKVVVVVVGIPTNSLEKKNDSWTIHSPNQQLCFMLGVKLDDLNRIAILERHKWSVKDQTEGGVVQKLPPTDLPAGEDATGGSSVEHVGSKTKLVGHSSPKSLDPTLLVQLHELVQAPETSDSSAAKKTSAARKTKSSAEKDQARIEKAQKRAQDARDQIQSLRNVCALRHSQTAALTKDDDTSVARLDEEYDRTQELLRRWEQLVDEEELQILREFDGVSSVAKSGGVVQSEGQNGSSTLQAVSQLSQCVDETRGSPQRTVVSQQDADSVSKPRTYRSPLLATPPSYHSPDGAVPSFAADGEARPLVPVSYDVLLDTTITSPETTTVDPTVEQNTIGDRMLHLFAAAAIGDISSRYTQWYVSLLLDLRKLQNDLAHAPSSFALVATSGNSAEEKKQQSARVRTIDSVVRQVEQTISVLGENSKAALSAREELTTITGREVSYAQFFLHRVVALLNSCMDDGSGDESSGVARTPTDDELQQVTAAVQQEHARLWAATRKIRAQMNAALTGKLNTVLTRAIQQVNVALGFAMDGAIAESSNVQVDADGEIVVPPAMHALSTRSVVWMSNLFNLAERLEAPERNPMQPLSNAQMTQRVLDGYALRISQEMYPRMHNYIQRMQIGVGAIMITLRAAVGCYLDWVESAVEREAVSNVLAQAQGFTTRAAAQQELAQWLGMQHMQQFLSENAMRLSSKILARQWSWDAQTSQSAAEDQSEHSSGEHLSGEEEDLLDESLGSEDESDESEGERESLDGDESDHDDQQDGDDVSDMPNIDNYAELEQVHHAIWSTDFQSEHPYDDKLTRKWARLIDQALEVRNIADSQVDASDDESGYSDDEYETSSDDENVTAEEKALDIVARKAYRKQQRASVPQHALQIGDVESMQLRDVREHSEAAQQLPAPVYNLMRESFAIAATDKNPNRWVFRPRNGFEHLTLELWRRFGAYFIDHYRRGRVYEYNAFKVAQPTADAMSARREPRFDVSVIYSAFLTFVEDQARRERAYNMPGSFSVLWSLQESQLKQTVVSTPNVSPAIIRAELIASSIMAKLMDNVWEYTSSSANSLMLNENGDKRERSMLPNDAVGAERALYDEIVNDSGLCASLRKTAILSAAYEFSSHAIWRELYALYYDHSVDDVPLYSLSSPPEMLNFIRLAISSLPANVSDERNAGALSRFRDYFRETSSAEHSVPVDFWSTLLQYGAVVNAMRVNHMDVPLAGLNNVLRQIVQKHVNTVVERPTYNTPTIKRIARMFDESYIDTNGNVFYVSLLSPFIQGRLAKMTRKMTECVLREFASHAVLGYAFATRQPLVGGMPTSDTSLDDEVAEIERYYPYGFATPLAGETREESPAVVVPSRGKKQGVRNSVGRSIDYEGEKRIRTHIADVQDRYVSNGGKLVSVLSTIVQHTSLTLRNDDDQHKSKTAFATDSIERANAFEARMWSMIVALASLRVVQWSGVRRQTSNKDERASYPWVYRYDDASDGDEAGGADVDLLSILHRVFDAVLRSTEYVHIHEGFAMWSTPTKARTLAVAGRLILPYTYRASESEAPGTFENNAMALFVLALPRHCNDVVHSIGRLHEYPGYLEKALSAESFVANTWNVLYDKLHSHAAQASRLLLQTQRQEMHEVLSPTSSASTELSGTRIGSVVPHKPAMDINEVPLGRRYLAGFDFERRTEGALFVDYNTGKPLDYVARKNEVAPDLKQYFAASGLVDLSYSNDVSTTSTIVDHNNINDDNSVVHAPNPIGVSLPNITPAPTPIVLVARKRKYVDVTAHAGETQNAPLPPLSLPPSNKLPCILGVSGGIALALSPTPVAGKTLGEQRAELSNATDDTMLPVSMMTLTAGRTVAKTNVDGTVDVPETIISNLTRETIVLNAAIDRGETDAAQPLAQLIERVCVATESAVNSDVNAIDEYHTVAMDVEEPNIDVNPQLSMLISQASVNQPEMLVAQSLDLLAPQACPPALQAPLSGGAFGGLYSKPLSSEALAAYLFEQFIAGIDEGKLGTGCTREMCDSIITRVSDLNDYYLGDEKRTLKCVADQCDDLSMREYPPVVRLRLKAFAKRFYAQLL